MILTPNDVTQIDVAGFRKVMLLLLGTTVIAVGSWHLHANEISKVTEKQSISLKVETSKKDTRPHLAIMIGEDRYKTDTTLPSFAKKELSQEFRLSFIFADKKDSHRFPNIRVLAKSDVVLLSIRRRALPEKQLNVIRKFIADGKPLVAIRTSSHAFALRDDAKLPADHNQWPEFDRDVLGCHYHGHYDNTKAEDPKTHVWVVEDARKHPIVSGLPKEDFAVGSWLYKHRPLASTTTLLMMGRVDDHRPFEPVAWTNSTPNGGRVFYTMLGHAKDFEMPEFRRLLANGIRWAADIPISKTVTNH